MKIRNKFVCQLFKIPQILIVLSFLLTFYAPVFGTTYYVRIVGNDTNVGTSWATAWKTVDKVNATIVSGDTVLFGAGDYLQSRIIAEPGNSITDKTVYSCSTYSMESANQATIYSGDSVGGWVLYSGSVYRAIWDPSDADPGFYNTVGGGFAHFPCVIGDDNIYTSRASVGDVNHEGYLYYDSVSNYLYIWPYSGGNPDVTGERILASARRGAVSMPSGCRYTEFFGLNIKMGFNGAIMFEESGGIKQSLNSFIHCNIAHANAGGFSPYGNNSSIIAMGGYGNASNPDTLNGFAYGNVFRGCNIYSVTADMGHEHSTHAGSGVTFYGMRQNVFDSCTFSLMPGAGVMWKGGGLDYYGNKVIFCTFDASDSMPYGRPAFTKLGVEHACGADRDSVYGCIFKNFYNAPAFGIAEIDCNWTLTWYYAGDFVGNNTFYNCYRFISGGAEAPEAGSDMIEIKYNVMYKVLGSSSQFVRSHPLGPILENTSYCIFDSNYWNDDTYGFSFYDQYGAIRDSVYWRSTFGYDLHSDFMVDPGLNDPANGDFSRPSASNEMNRTYGGRTWTVFGAIQEVDTSITQVLTCTDTTTSSFSLSVDFILSFTTVDSVIFECSDNDFVSITDADTIGSPIDPQTSILFVSENTQYKIRSRAWDTSEGITDTSNVLTISSLSSASAPSKKRIRDWRKAELKYKDLRYVNAKTYMVDIDGRRYDPLLYRYFIDTWVTR